MTSDCCEKGSSVNQRVTWPMLRHDNALEGPIKKADKSSVLRKTVRARLIAR